MDMDFKRKKLAESRQGKNHLRWLLVTLIIIGAGAGFFVYQYKHEQSLFAPYFMQMREWIAEHKPHLQNKLVVKPVVKNKQQAANAHEEPEIHFEFYNTLPTMQVNVAAAIADNRNSNEKNKPTPASIPPAHAKTAPANIVSAADLEQELSKHILQNTYVLQLGLFRSQSAAIHYRDTVDTDGLQADIVRTADNKYFRVQLGPFANKIDAKLAQLRLQKKGVNTLVRPVAES
jgi:cell division protein FtsN